MLLSLCSVNLMTGFISATLCLRRYFISGFPYPLVDVSLAWLTDLWGGGSEWVQGDSYLCPGANVISS